MPRKNVAWCPVCERRFTSFREHRGRPSARCPGCGALERHRMLVAYLRSNEHRWERTLHFAPEPQISGLLCKRTSGVYATADLFGANDLRLDITRLPFSSSTFDLIVCCHVLEHVPDDAAALSELRRVLTSEGTILLQVPQNGAADTDEDTSAGPEERKQRFGQVDHVRIYGEDFLVRLAEAELGVTVLDASHATSAEGDLRLPVDERLFVCAFR